MSELREAIAVAIHQGRHFNCTNPTSRDCDLADALEPLIREREAAVRAEPCIHDRVEASSLGAPEVKAARASVPDEVARRAVFGAHMYAKGRAEGAAELRERVEALAKEATERAYFEIAAEKMLTIQPSTDGRAKVPGHWREAAESAASVPVNALRAALADPEAAR